MTNALIKVFVVFFRSDYVDYLLVDSWYAKPNFINEVKENGIDVIARLSKSIEFGNLQENIIRLKACIFKQIKLKL